MKTQLTNQALSTSVSVSDDSNEREVMLEVFYDGTEAWHSFQSLTQLDEFIDSMVFYRNRFAKTLGAPATMEVSNG